MSLLRKFAATATAAVVMMAGGAVVAQADGTPSVYDTPGGRDLWWPVVEHDL